jgi:hypothetical protein
MDSPLPKASGQEGGHGFMSPGPLDQLAAIRALLAKAEAGTTTPPEAQALTAKAVSFLAQYGLDRARLAEVDLEADLLTDPVIDLDNPWAKVQAYLLAHLAEALRCEAIEITRPGPGTRLHLFGHASDIERVEILYTSLITQLSRALATQEVPGTVTSVRAWRRSWMIGWATSAATRVKATEDQAAGEAEDGLELAIVLSERTTRVRRHADQAYPSARETRVRYTAVRGYNVGSAHGHEADVDSSSNSS